MFDSTFKTTRLRGKRLSQPTEITSEPQFEANIPKRSMRLTARSPQTTTSSGDAVATTCGPNDRSGPCERMVAASPNTTTIPVVLGVVIPLTFAFVLLVFLHRRHVKKLRREDREDKNKSLDFGMDGPIIQEKHKKWRKRGPKAPEMSTTEEHHTGRGARQLSMDLSNPYLLPPELQGSRESLHSLSRSIHNTDDKYRATNFIPDDGSLRSPSSLRHRDDESIYTYSSRRRVDTESTRGLLPTVQTQLQEPVPSIQRPPLAAKDPNTSLLAPMNDEATRESYISTASSSGHIAAMRASNNYLGQFISGGPSKQPMENQENIHPGAELENNSVKYQPQQPAPVLLRGNSSKRNTALSVSCGFNFDIPQGGPEPLAPADTKIPQVDITFAEATNPEMTSPSIVQSDKPASDISTSHRPSVPEINIAQHRQDDVDYYDEDDMDKTDMNELRDVLGYDPRRLTMGFRPLPPDDPSENPEERALRIRSFYKEYFDETAKPGGEKTRLSYFDGSENYIDDYYGNNVHAGNNHDSYGYGQSHGPYRGPPPHGYNSRAPSFLSARVPPNRHRATISNGSFISGGQGYGGYGPGPYGPRANSSASGQYAGSRQRGPPRAKPAPPPSPLPVLPTPAMLKEDSMLPNPNDFAPPQLFKNQRSGTPDSLRGGSRPYSTTSGRTYNPLASSFDDLAVLPSPHQLRKSGTFTSLDFAPPRFATPATASDSGSIHSNRSGMSARQLHHIRAGAYRVSRLPKEVAGTKEELAQALKPQWNAR